MSVFSQAMSAHFTIEVLVSLQILLETSDIQLMGMLHGSYHQNPINIIYWMTCGVVFYLKTSGYHPSSMFTILLYPQLFNHSTSQTHALSDFTLFTVTKGGQLAVETTFSRAAYISKHNSETSN